jgi:long-chain acyl-CoA synthetase
MRSIPNSAPQEWVDEYNTFPKSIKTMQDFYLYTDRKTGSRPCMGQINPDTFEVGWLTRHELHQLALNVGTRLCSLGLERGSRIGVYSEGRVEAAVFLEAAQLFGYIAVFAFDTELPTYPRFIFADSGVTCIYISPSKATRITKILGEDSAPAIAISSLEFLIVHDPITKPPAYRIPQQHVDTFLTNDGSAALPIISPDEPCTICYSSGTIGAPKGVVLSHGAMVEGIWAIACSVNVTASILHVSHLPISHILERLTLYTISFRGGRIAFATNASRQAFSDMEKVHATAGPIIPSLLEDLHQNIVKEAEETWLGGHLMNISLYLSRACRYLGFKSRLANALVFNRVQHKLGGRLEWFVVAGAAFSREIHESLSAILGIDIVAIYGLSEAGGGVSVAPVRMIEPGTVGVLVPGTEVRLSEAGEILIRSKASFSTYWRAPEIAAEAHKDGWFRTGDKGSVDSFGNLVIHGRAFDILEYQPGIQLALPFLTMSYAKNLLISDLFITPFREEKCLIAMVVTTKEWIEYAYEQKGKFTIEQAEKRAHDPRFCNWVRRDLRRMARYEALPHGAYLAAIRGTIRRFQEDERLYTPTGKQRPNEFLEKFAGEFESMRREVVARHERKHLGPDEIEYDDEKDEEDEAET